MCHLAYFCLRVAAGIGVAAGNHGRYIQIIQPAEDTFLGDAQHAGENGEIQGSVCFEGGGVEGAEEADSILIVTMRPGALDGCVIFVNQEHDPLAMMGFQQQTEHLKGIAQRFQRWRIREYAFESCPHASVHFILQ